MRGIAIILSACLLFLNMGSILEGLHTHAEHPATECCSDEGSSCSDMADDHQDHEKSCKDDHHCTTGCHCFCGIHLAAAAFGIMEQNGAVVQSFHYGHYLNTYSFEYSDNFIRPPRMA